MRSRDVLHWTPDPIGEAVDNLWRFTIDSKLAKMRPKDISYMQNSMQGAASINEDGTFTSWLVTDNPNPVLHAIKKADLGELFHGMLCDGLYLTTATQKLEKMSRGRWAVIEALRPHEKVLVWKKLIDELSDQRKTGYISASEFERADTDLEAWVEKGDTYGPEMIGGQPYNIDVPGIIQDMGLYKIANPEVIPVHFEGRYLDLTKEEAQKEAYVLTGLHLGKNPGACTQADLCQVIRQEGWDGAFTRAGWSTYPEIVLWNPGKILQFGDYWRRPSSASLSGKYKPQPHRDMLEFGYDCPAKGFVQFHVWLNKGEMTDDAGQRGLAKAGVDKAQIPYCKKRYSKYID